MIGTRDLTQTENEYFRLERIAREKQGYKRLEGGVLADGNSYYAACPCGVKLAPGEQSAITTPCTL
jgi:hypothetical protein